MQYPPLEEVALATLVQHPQNPNFGDVGAIVESIRVNGWFGTVVASKRTRRILAGNHRCRAAAMLGIDRVPVYFVDVDEEAEARILLADNRTTRLGYDDDAGLAALLEPLAETPTGLAGTGYDGDDLDDLLDRLAQDALPLEERLQNDSVPLRRTVQILSPDDAAHDRVRQEVAAMQKKIPGLVVEIGGEL